MHHTLNKRSLDDPRKAGEERNFTISNYFYTLNHSNYTIYSTILYC